MWLEFNSKYSGIRRLIVEAYVRMCASCALHLPLKDRDIVRNIIASKNWERIQIGLVDVRKYASLNNGFSWILHVVDIYSRYSFIFPMRSKSADEVPLLFILSIGHIEYEKAFFCGRCSINCPK